MIPTAFRYWKGKFNCYEYTEQRLEFPAVPAGTEMYPLYELAPGTVTVTLPGLTAAEGYDLVNMALAEWRVRRESPMYVDKRYGHMPELFRKRRLERLEREMAALYAVGISTT